MTEDAELNMLHFNAMGIFVQQTPCDAEFQLKQALTECEAFLTARLSSELKFKYWL